MTKLEAGFQRQIGSIERLHQLLQQIATDYCTDKDIPAVRVQLSKPSIGIDGTESISYYGAFYPRPNGLSFIVINQVIVEQSVQGHKPAQKLLLRTIFHELTHAYDFYRQPDIYEAEGPSYREEPAEKHAFRAELRELHRMQKLAEAGIASLAPRYNPRKRTCLL